LKREMRVVTLCENSAGLRREVLAEHGFSAYVEFGDYKLIFDAGQTTTCVHNASVLKIDLEGVPIALSHGHYDHTGGLVSLLKKTGPVAVYAHPDVFASRYSRRGGALRQIGIPFKKEDLEKMGAEFEFSRKAREIHPGLWLTGEVPRLTEFETASENLVVISDEGEITVDPLLDDQALILVLERGLFVLLGCAHSGMINTLEHAKRVTGVDTVLGVAGGAHLGFGGEEKLPKTIEALRGLDLEILAPSHCTGFAAASVLAATYPDQFVFNCVGTEIVL
jgi:7,8-dihydropterin-6-yl-methyl-4-(beta-D-ribofuranosyl)aminobenzene 5'-phosphate synthase